MMWDAEPRIMIKACPICSASSQMKLIWADFLASTDAHWFETPTPIPKGRRRTILLWIVFFFTYITCQTQGRKWLPVGPRGELAVFHVRGTNS